MVIVAISRAFYTLTTNTEEEPVLRKILLACAAAAVTSAAFATPSYVMRVFAPGVSSPPVVAPPLPPMLSAFPSEWDFGTLALGAPGTKAFNLTNTGEQDATVAFGAISAPFSLLDNRCGAKLAPAASCTFTVQYQASAATASSTSLGISGSDPGVEISLSGRGAPPATSWKSVNLGRHNWYAMAYGAGRFVSLSESMVYHSPDGITWQTITPPGNYPSTFTGMTYGGGKFVGVSTPMSGVSYSATSADGLSWSIKTMPAGVWWDVAFGNGRFVAIDAAERAPRTAVSTDGIAWSAQVANVRLKSVAFGNGRFVASTWDTSNRVSVSTDGVTWSSHTLPASLIGKVSFANGRFILMGGTTALVSVDGVTWTKSTLPIDMRSSPPVAYGNGKYMAVAGFNGAGMSVTSTDGVNWSTTPLAGADWYTLAFGNGVFVSTSYNYSLVGYTN